MIMYKFFNHQKTSLLQSQWEFEDTLIVIHIHYLLDLLTSHS